MDHLQLYYFLLSLILILCKGISSVTLYESKSADKAILGDNQFTLSCQYTIETTEQLYSIELQRKRDSSISEAFKTIVIFQSPASPINVSYQDVSLESRTVATKPTDKSKTASLQFNSIECDDQAIYRWVAFYTDGINKNVAETLYMIVKANTQFVQDGFLSYSSSTNVKEGDVVTFQCSGDVGNEPIGHLGWFYYLDDKTARPVNVTDLAVAQAPVYQPSTCSYKGSSRLQLTMSRSFNNINVRCTVNQDNFTPFGEGFKQTAQIPVQTRPSFTSRTTAETTSQKPSTQATSTDPLQVICSTIHKVNCDHDIEPVCGSDDRTYINYCEFHKEVCQRHGLHVKHVGFC